MEENNKLTTDQKTENNEIIELKEDDLSSISAGADNQNQTHTNESKLCDYGTLRG